MKMKNLEMMVFVLFIIIGLSLFAFSLNKGLSRCDNLENEEYIYCAR